MRRTLIVLALAALVALTIVVPAQAHKGKQHNMQRLQQRGWECIDVGVGYHCDSPRVLKMFAAGKGPFHFVEHVFNRNNKKYLGHEFFIRQNLFNFFFPKGLRCPGDSTSARWELIPAGEFGPGTPGYYVCHEFDRAGLKIK